MGQATLLDIVKANGMDRLVGLIDETTKVHPELTAVAARTIKGISYKTLVRTALGSTSAGFRNANSGVAPVANTYENRTVEAFLLEARWQADKGVADSYEDGAAAYIAMEAAGIMEGQMQGLAGQMFYGTNATFGNSAGFPGLLQAYDATNMVGDAGGTSDNTASSVWFVRTGPQDVQWVWGNAGQIAVTPDTPQKAMENPILVTDSADSTKQFLGYVQSLTGRVGLQVGGTRAVARIKKLTADSGKGLTDALIFDALGKFPAGRGPNVCFMTQRSLMQLQKSRTPTTNSALKGNLAEWVPVAQAASILNLSTRHLRRLIQSHPDSTRLQRSVTDSTTHHLSQTTWHLNRCLVIALASAPHRATHAPRNNQIASISPKSVRLRKITPKTKNRPATPSDLFTSQVGHNPKYPGHSPLKPLPVQTTLEAPSK